MNRIHIEKLSVTGTKEDSHIEFANNLTIIAGPSDTGKSYIYKCIEKRRDGDYFALHRWDFWEKFADKYVFVWNSQNKAFEYIFQSWYDTMRNGGLW